MSRACLVTPQTMATVVDGLESKGLVSREQSPLHKRVLVVRLTSEGRAVVREADQAARAVERRLLAAFSAADADQFRRLLALAADILAADADQTRES